mmetsp:Transcript_28413/g.44673  ORF Transcript_28413/g.44673 Transcript_28413/m.44673 type:complete len:212 (-) Transcript_28413:1351-1986(-)
MYSSHADLMQRERHNGERDFHFLDVPPDSATNDNYATGNMHHLRDGDPPLRPQWCPPPSLTVEYVPKMARNRPTTTSSRFSRCSPTPSPRPRCRTSSLFTRRLTTAGMMKQAKLPSSAPISPMTAPTSSSVHWAATAVIEPSAATETRFCVLGSARRRARRPWVPRTRPSAAASAGKAPALNPANISGYPQRMAKPVAARAPVASGSSVWW